MMDDAVSQYVQSICQQEEKKERKKNARKVGEVGQCDDMWGS